MLLNFTKRISKGYHFRKGLIHDHLKRLFAAHRTPLAYCASKITRIKDERSMIFVVHIGQQETGDLASIAIAKVMNLMSVPPIVPKAIAAH